MPTLFLNIADSTLWLMPWFQELSNPNSFIWNKGPFIIGSCAPATWKHMESPKCTLYSLIFCCSFAWIRALSPLPPDSSLSFYLRCHFLQVVFPDFPILSQRPLLCALQGILLPSYQLSHLYIYFFSHDLLDVRNGFQSNVMLHHIGLQCLVGSKWITKWHQENC